MYTNFHDLLFQVHAVPVGHSQQLELWKEPLVLKPRLEKRCHCPSNIYLTVVVIPYIETKAAMVSIKQDCFQTGTEMQPGA
jgi:hypothetical protein